jgi:hypothetical protein
VLFESLLKELMLAERSKPRVKKLVEDIMVSLMRTPVSEKHGIACVMEQVAAAVYLTRDNGIRRLNLLTGLLSRLRRGLACAFVHMCKSSTSSLAGGPASGKDTGLGDDDNDGEDDSEQEAYEEYQAVMDEGGGMDDEEFRRALGAKEDETAPDQPARSPTDADVPVDPAQPSRPSRSEQPTGSSTTSRGAPLSVSTGATEPSKPPAPGDGAQCSKAEDEARAREVLASMGLSHLSAFTGNLDVAADDGVNGGGDPGTDVPLPSFEG